MRHDGLAFPEAVEQLAGLAGMEMPRPEPQEAEKYDRLKRLADALEAAAKWFEIQLHSAAGGAALAYLKGRGLDDRAIAEFRLGYAPPTADALRAALTGQGHDEAILEEVGLVRRPEDGRSLYGFFRNRVIFPVTDKRGRIIAFGGRILEGDGPKYVNSPEHALFHKGSVLYGLARARANIAKGERPVVVEGYMDVIALQSAGFGGAVAPLGTAFGEAQLLELWKMQEGDAGDQPPILCFDGDNAGRRAAARAVERTLPLLSPGHSVAVAFLPDGDDPDSLIRRGGGAEVKLVLDGAISLIDALWDFASGGRLLATPEQRAGLWADLDSKVRAIADREVQSLYRVELRRRFDATFLRASWTPRNGRGSQKRLILSGPRPTAVRRSGVLQARIMLAVIVNHPVLFDALSETFAEIDIPVAWEPLRRTVFDLLTQQPLDAKALGVHLELSGYRPQLEDILGPATTDHAKFVRPETPDNEVLAGWRDVWNMAHRRGLDKELAAVRADPNRGDDKTLERISRLGERRIDLLDAADIGDEALVRDDHQDIVARAIADALRVPPRDPLADSMTEFDTAE